MTKKRCGIYIRVSTQMQVEEGYSYEEQKEILIKRAEHEGKDGSCFGGKRAGSQQFQPRGHLKKTGADNFGKIWNKRKKKEHSVQDGK